jgi:hypothetical protein
VHRLFSRHFPTTLEERQIVAGLESTEIYAQLCQKSVWGCGSCGCQEYNGTEPVFQGMLGGPADTFTASRRCLPEADSWGAKQT